MILANVEEQKTPTIDCYNNAIEWIKKIISEKRRIKEDCMADYETLGDLVTIRNRIR